jgi:hypothetical protein
LCGQMVEEGGDFGGAHFLRMANLMEENESADPIDVGLAECGNVTPGAEHVGNPVEHFGGLRAGGVCSGHP